MAKILFDVDSSLASIGTADEVTALCGGIPPIPITDGIQQVLAVLNDLFVSKQITKQHPLLTNASVRETIAERSALALKHNVDCVIIDTLSHLQRNDMRLLEAARPNKAMEMQDWGVLGRMYNLALILLKRLPVPVIVNCHAALDKDQNGMFFLNAALKGSSADFIPEYFDCVLYTQVSKTKDGQRVFSWQTKPDAMRKAKDRRNLLPDLMPQDFSVVLNTYKADGYHAPKILVIGESGTGKSRALGTLPV